MRFLVLAFDYDGTLAQDGRVDPTTIDALERAKASGRKLLLVTGRELTDLRLSFDREDLFESIVAENGAVLYWPARREEQIIAEQPPEALVAALGANITPLSIGRVVIATWEPNETAVLEVIHSLGLEWQITFNKGAVMVLPPGVNKGTGLAAALEVLALSPHNVLGVGDAENDHAFLSSCECACAVANALPFVRERADVVSRFDHGAGVVDIINSVLADDFATEAAGLRRHLLSISDHKDGDVAEVSVQPYGQTLLVAGASGSGKSTVAHAFREALQQRGYQYCIIDPEGDYEGAEGVVHFGDPDHRPNDDSVLQHLHDPRANAVVNLLGMPLEDRPAYFARLLARLLELRTRTGHPHWIMIDEAHHMLPAGWRPTAMPERLGSVLLVTVHPESVAPDVLAKVDLIIGVGEQGHKALASFARAVGRTPPATRAEAGKAIAWHTSEDRTVVFVPQQPRGELHRHRRKYAEGDMQSDSFYFRGPEQKLNLRAQNLTMFLQIAEGVDDETWLHHLHRHDYSRWFRECAKDAELAEAAAAAETMYSDDVDASRAAIRTAIEDRYTASD